MAIMRAIGCCYSRGRHLGGKHLISRGIMALSAFLLGAGEAGFYGQLHDQLGGPVQVLDCDAVRANYRQLSQALPGVELHYALKPLPVAEVVATLLAEGASFDLASSGEVDLVASLGVPAARCIHTHPIKRPKDIDHALAYGVSTFVVDNVHELAKFRPYGNRVSLLVRVSFPNPELKVDLSKKFGALPEAVLPLLSLARAWGIPVQGLSFHVGSQVKSGQGHARAIHTSLALIEQARQEGHGLSVLDMGGGFPVSYHPGVKESQRPDLMTFCAPIREALAEAPADLRLIAEPGRCLVANAVTLVTRVMGVSERQGKPWYYLDDGVYGSFNGLMYDDAAYPLYVEARDGQWRTSVLAGPTCDSIDVIAEALLLPELAEGDLVVARMMGAYSWAAASEFNFFRRAQFFVVNGPQPAMQVA